MARSYREGGSLASAARWCSWWRNLLLQHCLRMQDRRMSPPPYKFFFRIFHLSAARKEG